MDNWICGRYGIACRTLVEQLGVTCIAPAYRQGPEYPFPAGINDAWDGLKWIVANAETELGVTLASGFIVGGSSAGGNMSAVLAFWRATNACLQG